MRSKALSVCFLLASFWANAATDQGLWTPLFDGVSLENWKAAESQNTFSVSEGAIVAHGPRAHLFYVGTRPAGEWIDFELIMEVKTSRGANSGVYLHTSFQETGFPETGYQIQIDNTNPYPSKTGSLYGIDDRLTTPVRDDEWFGLSIRVEGKRIVTKVNNEVICDYIEPEKPERKDEVKGSILGHGTIALQGHDTESKVRFRNIKIRSLAQKK